MGEVTIKKGNIFIKDVKEIDAVDAQKLADAGVRTVGDFLNACSTPNGVRELLVKTGIPENKFKGPYAKAFEALK